MKRVLALAATGLLWTGGCFADAPSGTGGTGETGETGEPSCIQGSLSCPCYPNETCDDTLVCFEGASVCVPDNCSPVVAGCPCPTEGCGDGLVCEGPICLPSGPDTSSSGTSDSGGSGSVGTSTSAVDTSATGDPPTATAVTLYFSSSLSPFTSGLGAGPSRTTAQSLCDTAMALALPGCVQAAALFSASDSDSVLDLPESADMPFSVPVVSTDGTPIADSFQDLLDNGPTMSLLNLGVSLADMPGQVPDFFWSGSQPDGTVGDNCDGWTAMDMVETGKGGQPTVSGQNEFWLSGNDFTCNEPAPLLCACWD